MIVIYGKFAAGVLKKSFFNCFKTKNMFRSSFKIGSQLKLQFLKKDFQVGPLLCLLFSAAKGCYSSEITM